jgi:hypothetical protein
MDVPVQIRGPFLGDWVCTRVSDWRLVDLFAAAILLVFAARYKPSALSKV